MQRIKLEPVLIYTAIVTAYSAATAAGWAPPSWVLWVAAALVAGGGVLVRGTVTPTSKI
jgi:hypothetical protein